VPKPSEASIPLRSYGEPEDIEDALVYLVNAPYVTGQILVIDGGAGIRYSHP
jgi:NAD(P)-dependent dehydrogenase (short-subunit alcohol dehydrogenase family)